MGKGTLRNKLCPCGSPRKYKDCCWDLPLEQIHNKYKGRIIKAASKEANVKTCFFPSKDDCSEKIIRAHSLQNNKILTKLGVDGYVYMINSLFNEDGERLKLEKMGRNEATTFTGFCQKHDKEVFAPIEDTDYEPGNKRQESLFAFRALSKEWHAKLKAKNMTEQFLKTIKRDELYAFNEGVTLALKDIEKEMRAFSDALVLGEIDRICTHLITFEGESDVAVSSSITMSHDFLGQRLSHFTEHAWLTPDQLFVTIFPQKGVTYCLLSHDCKASETFSFLETQLLQKAADEQKYLLSRLVIHHSENVVYSPRFIENLSKEQQELLETRVAESVKIYADESYLHKELGLSIFY